MEKVLEQALVDIITKATSAAETAGQFLVKQTPDVVQQVLWWNATESLVCAIIPAVFLVFFVVLFFKNISNAIETEEIKHIIPTVVGGVGFFISLFATGLNMNLTWLKIWIAPKLYLIEYAAKLIK